VSSIFLKHLISQYISFVETLTLLTELTECGFKAFKAYSQQPTLLRYDVFPNIFAAGG